MARFRIDTIGELARQLEFTPADTRATQIAAAEALLHEIDPDRAYPYDFIVYRITDYQPKTVAETDLLTGSALQHDLGLLIERVSDSLDLKTQSISEPVLSIDDVTEKFNVTSKTIQRWRRKGLPARRFVFPDGKRRVGFLLNSVERFVTGHREQVERGANFSQVSDSEKEEILRRARRLAVLCECCKNEIARRIGKRLNRSPLTIQHTIRKHDAEHPSDAIFPLASPDITEEERTKILRGYKRGLALGSLARRSCRTRSSIYRVIVDERIARLNKRKVKFIDDPLYHEEHAADAVQSIVSQEDLTAEAKIEDTRVPKDLPPYLRELYRTPLLSKSRERALFLKFNFHKYQFVAARRKLEPEFAKARDLEVMESHLAESTKTKNELLRANLRLVVSVARKHLRPGLSLMELISEGNITLIRAVEGFDIHKGFRFSTYATLALMKGMARSVPMILAGQKGGSDVEAMAIVPDSRIELAATRRLDRDHVGQLLSRLDDRERTVLLAHYGLENEQSAPATLEQVGQLLGLSKQRVRQIEQRAICKLRQGLAV